MKSKKCKNKKCQRPLPEGYKHRYCENCRNKHINEIKDAGKAAAGVVALVGSVALAVVTGGLFKPKL